MRIATVMADLHKQGKSMEVYNDWKIGFIF